MRRPCRSDRPQNMSAAYSCVIVDVVWCCLSLFGVDPPPALGPGVNIDAGRGPGRGVRARGGVFGTTCTVLKSILTLSRVHSIHSTRTFSCCGLDRARAPCSTEVRLSSLSLAPARPGSRSPLALHTCPYLRHCALTRTFGGLACASADHSAPTSVSVSSHTHIHIHKDATCRPLPFPRAHTRHSVLPRRRRLSPLSSSCSPSWS